MQGRSIFLVNDRQLLSSNWKLLSSSTGEILPYEQYVVKKRDHVLKHNLINADLLDYLLIKKNR